ncbi:bacteriocin immunity protein [Lactovum odontotermitis]
MVDKSKKNKKVSIDLVLLQEICEVLQSTEITKEERKIFETARQRLTKKEYYLKVAVDLRGELTPIVVKQESSKKVSEFYSKLTSPDYTSKGLGGLVAFSAPGIGW